MATTTAASSSSSKRRPIEAWGRSTPPMSVAEMRASATTVHSPSISAEQGELPMTFNDRLSQSSKTVQSLFQLLDDEISQRHPNTSRYSTDKPDYRLAQPKPGHVYCEVIPMLREPSLRLNIRVGNANLPSVALDMKELRGQRPGGRWIQVSLTKGSDLASAIRLLAWASALD